MNTIRKALALPLAAAFLLAAFTSCSDNIYNMILDEVELEDGLEGDIHAIVPFGSYLYLTNFNIYRKPLTSSNESGQYNEQWSKVSAPGDYVAKLASDGTYLYAYTLSWTEDDDDGTNIPDSRTLWYSSDGSNWNQIDLSSTIVGSKAASSKVALFDNQYMEDCTNASRREAFVTLYNGSTYTTYQLNGETLTEKKTDSDYIRAAYLNGKTCFSPYSAIAANGTYLYYAKDGSTLYYTSTSDNVGSLSDEKSVNLDHGTISSIAVTSDYLLLGTTSGIARVALTTDGVPDGDTSSFDSGNNAASQLTGYIPLVYTRNPEAAEAQDDEYAGMVVRGYLSSSTVSFNKTGLYAWYKGRGKWNRDGD